VSAWSIADGVMAVSCMPQACTTACAAPDVDHVAGIAQLVYLLQMGGRIVPY